MIRRNRAEEGSIFMNSDLIAKVVKNKRAEIRVALLRNNMVDVRIYFYFPDSPDPKPTKKGAWIAPKHLGQIVNALEKLTKDPAVEVSLEFDLSRGTEKFKAYTGVYLKTKLFHIRTFYLKGNEYTPGKGVSFPVALAPQIYEALKTAKEKLGKESK